MTAALAADGRIVYRQLHRMRAPWTRAVGLIGRKHIDGRCAYLFAHCASVHTCFMSVPIDVIICDRHLRVLHVETMRPWRASSPRIKGARCIVEAAAGTAAAGIAVGSQLTILKEEGRTMNDGNWLKAERALRRIADSCAGRLVIAILACSIVFGWFCWMMAEWMNLSFALTEAIRLQIEAAGLEAVQIETPAIPMDSFLPMSLLLFIFCSLASLTFHAADILMGLLRAVAGFCARMGLRAGKSSARPLE